MYFNVKKTVKTMFIGVCRKCYYQYAYIQYNII